MRVISEDAGTDDVPPYHVDRKDKRRYGNGLTPNAAWMDAALRHAAATRRCADARDALDTVDDDLDVTIDRKPGDFQVVVAGGGLAASVAAPAAHLELPLAASLLLCCLHDRTLGSFAIAAWLIAGLIGLVWATNRTFLRFENGRLRVRERWFPWRMRSWAAHEVLRVEEVRFQRDAWSLALQVRRGDAPPRWVLVRTKLRRHADVRALVEAIRGVLEPAAAASAYRSALPSRNPAQNETEGGLLEARRTS